MGIDDMDSLKDVDRAEILTEISRGVNKWLWLVNQEEAGEGESEKTSRSSFGSWPRTCLI
jgi:hypothetical protein